MYLAAILQSLEQICGIKPELTDQVSEIREHLQALIAETNKIQEERDQFRSYLENAIDTIAILDLDGRVIYTTENWARQLGIDSKDVHHERIFERFMHPEDAPKAQEFFQATIDTKQSQSGFEYRIRHSDGSWRWHMASISPIFNESGEVESIVSIGRSIHKQKIAEIQVRESEAHLRLILDTMHEGVIMVDNSDRILYVNQSLCDLYGFTAEEMIGKIGYEQMVVPEDHHTIVEKNEQRLSGMADDYEVRGRTKSGKLIWLSISGAPLKDDGGVVIGSVGIMTDITQKHKILQALLRSEEKYRHLFENSLAGVFQSSFQDQYLNVNPAFATMFGFESPKEMIESVSDIKALYVDPEEREDMKRKLVQDGFVENYELELKRKDGRHLWISLYAKFGTDEDGNLMVEGTCMDITESKSLKEQLLASQKMEAIGKLAGGVAHDFNNLLTIILGYTEDIMENLNPSSQLYGPTDEIMKAGLRAANLTRQLLAFSRKQIIQNKEVNFNSIVNNLRGIISRLIGEEIQVSFLLNDDLANVKADPSQIEQVLINIVINAREAMSTGGQLTIKTANQDVDATYTEFYPKLKVGKYVMLSISDTGHGMDKDTLSHLFEPFFSTKDKSQGSGLGLASAYGIIVQTGGVIIPYSEPGKGTTMKILLPELLHAAAEHSESPMPSSLKGKGQKILVVEDEEALCRIVQKMLQNLGYSVESTGSSLDALKRLDSGEQFDLVITDVVMPEMNGKELADAMLKLNPAQKILFVSGFADDVIAQHGILDPSLPFIQKPFSAKTIAPTIQKLLRDSQASLNLLILDDEEGICKLFQRSAAKRGHHSDAAGKLSEALDLLPKNQYDMLLVDMNLNGCSGIEAIQSIRETGCTTPIVILSSMVQGSTFDNLHKLGVLKVFEKSFDNNPILEYIEKFIQERAAGIT